MTELSLEKIKECLKVVKYPGFSRDIVSFGLLKAIELEGSAARISLGLASKDPKIAEALIADIEKTLIEARIGIELVSVSIIPIEGRTVSPRGPVQRPAQVKDVRYFVAVGSGKGGVGKSSVTVNLAVALQQLLGSEKRVGILDADIYGPSIPLMMGVEEAPEVENDLIQPLERYGIRLMSMGMLIDTDAPVVWRGPMIIKAIGQFVNDVNWGKLEILLIDLPPGTGDAQLSITQALPVDGAVIVTTPQVAAFSVARRGAMLFPKVKVPLLGVVENMSDCYDPKTGTTLSVFGKGGGRLTAEALETAFLGTVPLDPLLREASDQGHPAVLSYPDAPASQAILQVAMALLERLAAQEGEKTANLEASDDKGRGL